jgi:hypothetical protein
MSIEIGYLITFSDVSDSILGSLHSVSIGMLHVFAGSEQTIRINSPRKSTKYMVGSVLARKIKVWNFLSVPARVSSLLQGFKHVVRTFLGIFS